MMNRARWTTRKIAVLVAVAVAISLSAPSLLADKPESDDGSKTQSAAQVISTMEIVNGLSQAQGGEPSASPFVPPGHAKHDGPDAPPGHAKHHNDPDGPPGHNKDRSKPDKPGQNKE
jgi:hypothetical protein